MWPIWWRSCSSAWTSIRPSPSITGPIDGMPATLRLATAGDVAGIVRVYVRAYAQPPWNERNDPASSERYLRWVMNHPYTFCVVALGHVTTWPPDHSLPSQGVSSATSTDSEAHAEDVRGFVL